MMSRSCLLQQNRWPVLARVVSAVLGSWWAPLSSVFCWPISSVVSRCWRRLSSAPPPVRRTCHSYRRGWRGCLDGQPPFQGPRGGRLPLTSEPQPPPLNTTTHHHSHPPPLPPTTTTTTKTPSTAAVNSSAFTHIHALPASPPLSRGVDPTNKQRLHPHLIRLSWVLHEDA